MKTVLKPKKVVFDQEGYNELVDRLDSLEKMADEKEAQVMELKKSIKRLYKNLGSVLQISPKQFEILLIRETEVFISTNPGTDNKPRLGVI